MTQAAADPVGPSSGEVPNLSGPVELGEVSAFAGNLVAEPFAVRSVLEDLERCLIARLGRAEVIGDLALVLAEVLNNVVEHAHAGRTDGGISVEVFLRPCCVRCLIRDDGAAMPGLQLPLGLLPNSDTALEDLPEGGFGWFLIHNMTADLSYCREDGENRLQFHLPMSPVPPGR